MPNVTVCQSGLDFSRQLRNATSTIGPSQVDALVLFAVLVCLQRGAKACIGKLLVSRPFFFTLMVL